MRKNVILSPFLVRYAAKYITATSLTISAGWTEMGPNRNHRRAPLAATPSDGTSTMTSSSNMHSQHWNGEFLPERVIDPRREMHKRKPKREPGDLPLQKKPGS